MREVAVVRRVRLVERDQHAAARLAEQLRDVAVDRCEALANVEQEDDHVGLVDRDPGLGFDRRTRRVLPSVQVEARRVDDRELATPPLGNAVKAVSGEARLRVDDRLPPTDHAVEKRRFADVRSADDRDDGPGHPSIRRDQTTSSGSGWKGPPSLSATKALASTGLPSWTATMR